MKKHRATKKIIKRQPPKAPEVKAVVLPPNAVLQVKYPGDVRPLVAVDHIKKVVEIVPVPHKRGWWSRLFD